MRRFGMALAALSLAACTVERTEKPASDTAAATATPLRCEGVSGIEKLGLETKADLVGFSGDRVFLRSGARCESVTFDGKDAKPCPAPDAKTTAKTLLGEDATHLYFHGADADGDVLFRTSLADGGSKALFRGKATAKLAGDRLLWSDGASLWSMPKSGGTPKKLFSGSVVDFAANGAEIMIAGKAGIRVLVDDEPSAASFASDGGDVDAVAFTDAAIAFRQAESFGLIDRTTGQSKTLWKLPEHVTAEGFALEGSAILTYVDEHAFVRIASDKPAALIVAKTRVSDVTHHGGRVFFRVDDQLFRVSETSFGRATIRCSDQPLAAPTADAGRADAGARDAGAKDAGTNDAAAPVRGDDDDEVETSSDATEPTRDPGSTVVIHPACASVPGPAGSSFGAALGLGLLALRRRRRRQD